MQEQRGFVEQPLGTLHALDHDALGAPAQLALLFRRELAPGEHHDRDVPQSRIVLDLGEQLEAGDVRQLQIQDHAVELHGPQQVERLAAGAGACDA